MTDLSKLASLKKSLKLNQQDHDQSIFRLRQAIAQLERQITAIEKGHARHAQLTNSRIALLTARLHPNPAAP